MKAKKILAILASLCMLLTLVPAMAVAAEDTVTLPTALDGAPNYADLSTVESYQNNSAELPTVDTEAGTILLKGCTNGSARVEFDLDGLTAADDYVISFTVSGIQNWHSNGWGLRVGMVSDGGVVSKNQSLVLAGKANATAFYDNSATAVYTHTTALTTATHNFNIYVDADAAAGTRTYHVYFDGTLVYSSDAFEAIEPQLGFNGSTGGSNNFTLSNINVFKVGEVGFPTIPETNKNWVLDDTTTLSGSGNNMNVANFDKETNAFAKVELQNNMTFVATPHAKAIGDKYVVSGNVLFANGWNGSIAALTVADGAVLKANKDTSTGGDILVNDTIVASGYRTALTSGDGLNFAAYVNGTTVYFFVEGKHVGTVEGVTPSKTLKIGTSKAQWGDYITLSNFALYNLGADPDIRALPAQGENPTLINTAGLTLGHSKESEGGAPATYDAATDTVTLTGSGNGESFANADLTMLNGADYVVTFKHTGMTYGTSWNMRVQFGNGSGRVNFNNSATGVVYTDADGVATSINGVSCVNSTSVYAIWFEANEDGTYNYIFFDDGAWMATVANQPAPAYVRFDQQGSHSGYAPKFSNFATYQVGESTTANITVTETVEGGTATGSALTLIGNEVTITATEAEGYVFLGWLKDDGTEYVSTDAEYTFTVEGDATYTPVFAVAYTVKIGWTSVSYTIDGVPGVDPTEVFDSVKSFTVPADATVSITMILPESKVAHFKDGNNGWATLQLNNPVYTIEGVAADWNVILQPDTKPYVTFEIEGEGTLDKETGYLFAGEQITATPAEGWEFSHFEVTIGEGDMVEYTANPLENPSRNGQTATVTAVFTEIPVTYTIQIGYVDVEDVQYYTVEGVPGVDKEQQFFGPQTFVVPEGARVWISQVVANETLTPNFKDMNTENWDNLQTGATRFYIESVEKDYVLALQPDIRPYVTVEIVGKGTFDKETGYWGEWNVVTATPADGWVFGYYEVTIDGDTKIYTDNPWTSQIRNAQVATCKVVFLGAYSVTIEDAVGGTTTGATDHAYYGEIVTLTATADEGYEFAYWMINNRTYKDAELAWTVNNDVVATPVFRPIETEVYRVVFRSADGRVIATLTSTEIEEGAALPAVPARYGYTDGAWDFEPADGITADMSVYPTYTKAATTYTITAVGGVASKETAEYETRVKVTATVNGFTAWVDENGTVLSTDREYVFFVTRDITVTASTEAAADYAVAINPTSLNTDNGSTYTMTLVGETMIGEGYRLIECGFVYTTKALDADSLKLGNAGVKKVISTKLDAGQYALNLSGAPKTATITARAYMVIEKDGVQTTVYSGLCDASWN